RCSEKGGPRRNPGGHDLACRRGQGAQRRRGGPRRSGGRSHDCELRLQTGERAGRNRPRSQNSLFRVDSAIMRFRSLLLISLWAACGSSVPASQPAPEAKPSEGPFDNFKAREPRVGAVAPDFSLDTVSGERVTLAEAAREQPVALIFGSYSCPLFRMKTPA